MSTKYHSLHFHHIFMTMRHTSGSWVHIIVSKRNVSKQLLSNQNHAEPVGDMLLKSRR